MHKQNSKLRISKLIVFVGITNLQITMKYFNFYHEH